MYGLGYPSREARGPIDEADDEGLPARHLDIGWLVGCLVPAYPAGGGDVEDSSSSLLGRPRSGLRSTPHIMHSTAWSGTGSRHWGQRSWGSSLLRLRANSRIGPPGRVSETANSRVKFLTSSGQAGSLSPPACPAQGRLRGPVISRRPRALLLSSEPTSASAASRRSPSRRKLLRITAAPALARSSRGLPSSPPFVVLDAMVGEAITRAYGYFYVFALLVRSTPTGVGLRMAGRQISRHEEDRPAAMNSGRRGLSASRARGRPAPGRRRSWRGWPTGRALAVRSWPESGAAPLGWHPCEVECQQG
jgi:hypothetical protein